MPVLNGHSRRQHKDTTATDIGPSPTLWHSKPQTAQSCKEQVNQLCSARGGWRDRDIMYYVVLCVKPGPVTFIPSCMNQYCLTTTMLVIIIVKKPAFVGTIIKLVLINVGWMGSEKLAETASIPTWWSGSSTPCWKMNKTQGHTLTGHFDMVWSWTYSTWTDSRTRVHWTSSLLSYLAITGPHQLYPPYFRHAKSSYLFLHY